MLSSSSRIEQPSGGTEGVLESTSQDADRTRDLRKQAGLHMNSGLVNLDRIWGSSAIKSWKCQKFVPAPSPPAWSPPSVQHNDLGQLLAFGVAGHLLEVDQLQKRAPADVLRDLFENKTVVVPLRADSVRRKRKHKMNKHKHRKRLKKIRHKNK